MSEKFVVICRASRQLLKPFLVTIRSPGSGRASHLAYDYERMDGTTSSLMSDETIIRATPPIFVE